MRRGGSRARYTSHLGDLISHQIGVLVVHWCGVRDNRYCRTQPPSFPPLSRTPCLNVPHAQSEVMSPPPAAMAPPTVGPTWMSPTPIPSAPAPSWIRAEVRVVEPRIIGVHPRRIIIGVRWWWRDGRAGIAWWACIRGRRVQVCRNRGNGDRQRAHQKRG